MAWTRQDRFPDGAAWSKLDSIVYYRGGWRTGGLLPLKQKAEEENWGENNSVLQSYICQLFKCVLTRFLQSKEGNPEDYNHGIQFTSDGEAFVLHTGLVDPAVDSIYGCFSANYENERFLWKFDRWCNEYDLKRSYLPVPKRFQFFRDFHQLYFNPDIELICNAGHCLEDSESHGRVRAILDPNNQVKDKSQLAERLKGAITMMQARARQNFRLVVPQFFCDKKDETGGEVQLLLPLNLENQCLVVACSKQVSYRFLQSPDGKAGKKPDPYNPAHWEYLGSTVLTRKMAYNNARLINRLESNWLTVDAVDEGGIFLAAEESESTKSGKSEQKEPPQASSSHGTSPKSALGDLKADSTFCPHFQKTGWCKYGERCKYSHGEDTGSVKSSKSEQKEPPPQGGFGGNVKSGAGNLKSGLVLCTNYQKGWCKFGDNCRFSHSSA